MNRREFLYSSVAVSATLGLSPLSSLARSIIPPLQRADACILIYLPGGASQRDLWDIKDHTPFRKGMRAAGLLSTCSSISTSAKNIRIGQGLENLAAQMHHATIVRSLIAGADAPSTHLQSQRLLLTGQSHQSAPSLGATIATRLGQRDTKVPPYIYLGRDASPSTDEDRHIHQTLTTTLSPSIIPSTRSASFADNLLLAKHLLDSGARFIQVEYPYTPFQGFDTHEFGHTRTMEMKQTIDAPLARFIQHLDNSHQLDHTLVVLLSEFGRTISPDHPIIRQPSQYGFHSHFPTCTSAVFFGGPLQRGTAYGKSADHHPMIAVENPVTIHDLHATVYAAMGIAHQTERGTPINALFA